MPNRKIAVFTTSDIHKIWDESPTAVQVSTADDGTPLYTTGGLENALAEGYEIYVMSSRAKFGTHDAWWRALVPAENITVGAYTNGGANDEGFIEAWRELYRKLGYDPATLRLEHELTAYTEREMLLYGSHTWIADSDPHYAHYTRETWMMYYESLHQVGIEVGRMFTNDHRRRSVETAKRRTAKALQEYKAAKALAPVRTLTGAWLVGSKRFRTLALAAQHLEVTNPRNPEVSRAERGRLGLEKDLRAQAIPDCEKTVCGRKYLRLNVVCDGRNYGWILRSLPATK